MAGENLTLARIPRTFPVGLLCGVRARAPVAARACDRSHVGTARSVRHSSPSRSNSPMERTRCRTAGTSRAGSVAARRMARLTDASEARRGEAGAWNSNQQSPGFSGTWWFGQPHGEFAFLDAKERVRARATTSRRRSCAWKTPMLSKPACSSCGRQGPFMAETAWTTSASSRPARTNPARRNRRCAGSTGCAPRGCLA